MCGGLIVEYCFDKLNKFLVRLFINMSAMKVANDNVACDMSCSINSAIISKRHSYTNSSRKYKLYRMFKYVIRNFINVIKSTTNAYHKSSIAIASVDLSNMEHNNINNRTRKMRIINQNNTDSSTGVSNCRGFNIK